MSEDNKPTSRISSVKKKLQSAGLTDQPSGTQRVSSIVAKSKDPSSLTNSTSGSLLRKKLTNTIASSGSTIANSLKQTDDEIKKTRRKSFGEQKEKETSPTITTTTINTTSKLKPKSTLTSSTIGKPSSSSSSSLSNSKLSITPSSTTSKLTKSTTAADQKEKVVTKKTSSEEKSTASTSTILPPAPSLLSSVIYTKPLKDSDDNKKETTATTTTTTTNTTSTPTTPSINKVVKSLKRKSIESGNIFQFDQAKEEAVAAIINTETQISKDKSEKDITKKKQRVTINSDEEDDQEEFEESGLKKKKSSKSGEKKKKSSSKKSKSTEDEADMNEEGNEEKKKKKKKRVSTIISTSTTGTEEVESLFDGSSSVIGTTSNVATKKSKSYPKTPLPNKIKSYDEIMEEHDEEIAQQPQQPIQTNNSINTATITNQPQYYQPPTKTPSYFNDKFSNSSNRNKNVYYTPKSAPATPNTTSQSIHNYPESPSPAAVANGFEYSDSPITIPNISNISFNSDRDISFQTDEQFLNAEADEDYDSKKQLKFAQKQEKMKIISNSKLGESKLRYVLLVISFATWFYLLFLLFSFFYHFNDPIFCDTGVIPKKFGDKLSCIPCPDKGICMNGLFDSCIDGYVPRDNECILNPNKVESLVSTISQIDLILRDRRGLYECGSKDTFHMTADELMKEITKRNWFSKNKAIESFNTILDFVDNRRDSEEIGLDSKLLSPISVTFEDEQFKYYTNNQGIRPLWCQTMFFFKNLIKSNLHYIGIVIIGILTFKGYQYNNKKKQEELLAIDFYTKKAIRVLQERKEFEESYVSELFLKDEVVGTTDDKKLNRIWTKVLEKLESNVKILNTVRYIHGESRPTFEWADNKTPRKSIQSPIEFDHDEKSKDFGYEQPSFDDSFN
ncbi:hypothetical protein DICPUDRAFT_158846 [Dictyostelium purpureum]|uniref:Man1/Src1-like C-terminal domain-containing protein n=1 Tax=Dictyostelium purpureum TaxID=5786 RepID=F1A2M7_DICPU|nr:uncharacterized protein DICPUDRAFT_158846 [Dictyostelium purpureum]EGC29553.1 hypothetical protein DICPUDRAFT_158846 [Dictyostelium purpureum]|eukprot:XP_003293923.1 hypothetical protein DICPUDRAFT_158846 [Dictyostelium purpureum]